jgi:hypothetical protein
MSTIAHLDLLCDGCVAYSVCTGGIDGHCKGRISTLRIFPDEILTLILLMLPDMAGLLRCVSTRFRDLLELSGFRATTLSHMMSSALALWACGGGCRSKIISASLALTSDLDGLKSVLNANCILSPECGSYAVCASKTAMVEFLLEMAPDVPDLLRSMLRMAGHKGDPKMIELIGAEKSITMMASAISKEKMVCIKKYYTPDMAPELTIHVAHGNHTAVAKFMQEQAPVDWTTAIYTAVTADALEFILFLETLGDTPGLQLLETAVSNESVRVALHLRRTYGYAYTPIMIETICRNGTTELAADLVATGHVLNVVQYCTAVSKKHIDILELYPSMHAEDACFAAVKTGDLTTVRWVVDHAATEGVYVEFTVAMVKLAIIIDSVCTLEYVLERCPAVFDMESYAVEETALACYMHVRDPKQPPLESMLHHAIAVGKTQIAIAMIHRRSPPLLKTYAMHEAAARGNFTLVQHLHRCGTQRQLSCAFPLTHVQIARWLTAHNYILHEDQDV